MEYSLIDQFVIDELKSTRAENKELIKENEELKLKLNNEIDTKQTFALTKLGIGYCISGYDYRIKEENIEDYKKALKEKDFKWLRDHDYKVNIYNWNYEIHAMDQTLRLDIFANNYGNEEGVIQANVLKIDYFDIEEAKNALLKELEEDIAYKEKKFNKDKETGASEND